MLLDEAEESPANVARNIPAEWRVEPDNFALALSAISPILCLPALNVVEVVVVSTLLKHILVKQAGFHECLAVTYRLGAC